MATEEIRREDKLEDAIEEYQRVKAMYNEWWSEEKLDYLEDALAFISGEPLPIKKVGNKLWMQECKDTTIGEIYACLGKAIKLYKKRREYWREVMEDKISDIAFIVPRGRVVELDGEVIEGISEAV